MKYRLKRRVLNYFLDNDFANKKYSNNNFIQQYISKL